MSAPEVILWHRLRRRPGGIKFRRQHPAGAYVLDFFCSEAKLAIEIDGMSHEMGAGPRKVRGRDIWLQARDVATLRIAAGDVARSAGQVIEWIVATCIERSNPLHPSASLSRPPPRPGEESE